MRIILVVLRGKSPRYLGVQFSKIKEACDRDTLAESVAGPGRRAAAHVGRPNIANMLGVECEMWTFTLDSNCIISVDEGGQDIAFVRRLADAHAVGKAHVAVVALSAAEKKRTGSYLDDFDAFRDRLAPLGLARLEILKPMAYFDISFPGWCVEADDAMAALEKQIHDILFPHSEFMWEDYADAKGLDPDSLSPRGDWRRQKCAVQEMWTHIHNKRDVFVTADDEFHKPAKKDALFALGAGQIERPAQAASLL
jgi:hypothetical protein